MTAAAENNEVQDDGAFIDFESIQTSKLVGEKGGGEKENDKVDINPDFALYIIDLFITRIIAVTGKFMGYEIKPADIALTQAEIRKIRPHAAKALAKFIMWLEGRFPDYYMFIMVLVITYGSKTMLYAKKVEKGKPQKPPADQKPARKTPPKTAPKKRITRTNQIK